jgi:hypothetical protein
MLTLAEIKKILDKDFNQTNYEKRNGIIPTSVEVLRQTTDLIVYKINKSDGQIGLKIVFRIGLNNPYWFIWTPLETQIDFLIQELPDIYQEVNKHNTGA